MTNSLSLKTLALVASVAVAGAIAGSSMAAAAKSGANVGALECVIEPGVGLILGSSKEINCTFKPTSGKKQRYKGTITKIGVDIGVTDKSYVTWLVFAPGSVARGALAGDYGGVSAQATVGVGLGANALVGGLKKSITLQPLSVQGQTGLNVAAGVAGLKLKYVK